jgi:hypothetical protein
VFKNIWVKSLLVVFGSALIGFMPAIVADAANPKSEVQNGTVVENHTQIANRPSRQAPNDVFRSRHLSLARRLHLF